MRLIHFPCMLAGLWVAGGFAALVADEHGVGWGLAVVAISFNAKPQLIARTARYRRSRIAKHTT